MKKTVRILTETFKKCSPSLITVILAALSSAFVFYLYELPLEPFLYVLLLVAFTETVFIILTYLKEKSNAMARTQMIRSVTTKARLPEPCSFSEQDYQEAIRILQNKLDEIQNEYILQRNEDVDYYTAWVHQIKTPISVMRMQIGCCNAENKREFEEELFRIEQYVDMVLTYIRLGGDSNDLVIREYQLDDIIRESIRKFASGFVLKRLRLTYDGTDCVIITDKKWFSVILEQIISNAVKYTPYGEITVSLNNNVLDISDTGIGIAREDIPRIFEKGFTGSNGRLEKRSSGLGLYLCKKSADLLNIPLSVESAVGKGSTFSLDLSNKIKM